MLSVREIAEVAHETNKAYCDVLGDDSQPFWEDAPAWQVDSAINGVGAIFNGTVTRPEQSHENWLSEKDKEGWIYGESKNPEQKTHPCMVPFDELPKEQQMKDHLFFAVVTILLGKQHSKETLRERFDNFLSPAIKGLGTNEYNQLLDKLVQQC